MAEYAGLEIRIGGNTTKLTNALKASTKSAAELQRQIRQITRAMQFDPTNLKNVDTRIRITGDRMQSLQSKIQITRTAMEQLGDSIVKLGGKEVSVKEVASQTQNLSLAAKQADERYNKLTGSLAQIYEAWNRLSRDKGADFMRQNMMLSQADADRLMRSTTTLREFEAELSRIQQERANDPLSVAPLISDEDIARAKEFKELNFHDMFKRGLSLDDVVDSARSFGIAIEDSAISTVRDLQKTFKEAQQDKKALDDALRFDQMGTDVQRLDSEVESLSQTMRRLDDGMTEIGRTPFFQDAEARIRSIDASIDNLDADLERTGEAMKIDPGNVELAKRYFDDLQQKAKLTEEKVTILGKQMELLDFSGASEATKSHEDLAKWIEESAEAARKAQKELSNQRAEVSNLEDQVTSLSQAISMVRGDETLAGYSDAVLKWKKGTQELSDAMKELAKREQDVATQQKALDTAQMDFDKAQAEVEKYEKQLEELRAEIQRLAATINDPSVSDDVKFVNFERLGELNTELQQVEGAYKTAQAQATSFNTKLEEQQERAKVAKNSLEQQQAAVDELSESVDKLASAREVKLFQNPTDEIEKTEAELVQLQGQLDKAKAKENELETAYDSAKTENELAKTAQAMREVSQESDDAKASLKKVQDELKFSSDAIINPSTVKSLGMTLSATVTPALTALGYKMADAGATVDSAYRDMRKTVEGTEEQFEALRKSAIEFSRTHVTSADQILQIEAIGGELGVATDSLETFAEVISNIDVATNLDVDAAAETLGHLANILHLTEKDYVGFSDALVRLGNNGASTETEIANIAERIGSMGSIVGMSGSDILALASSIASTGQNAEAAGTAISRTMSFFETAVASAGGSIDASFDSIDAAVQEGGDKLTVFASLAGMTADEFSEKWQTESKEMASDLNEHLDSAKGSLQKIADVAHMSSDEFIKAWEDNPIQVFKAFIEGLNDVEKAEGSADKVLQDLGIKAVRQKQAIEGLMQTVGGLNDNLRMSEDAWNGISDEWGQAGDAANEAAKKAEGFSGQMQILKNIGQNALAELSEGAVPWIHMLSDGLQDLSEWFSTLSVDTKKWVVALGGVTAALGPMLSIGATVAESRGQFHKWVDTALSGSTRVKLALASGGKEAADSLKSTMSAMEKVQIVGGQLGMALLKGLAVGAVVAGIAVIGYSLYQLYKRYQDHVAATEGLTDAISGIGSASVVAAGEIDGAKASIGELMDNAGRSESRLADLTRTLEDSNRQYSNYAGQLNNYARTIEALGDKSDRSKEETSKLAAALEGVNEQCNTNLGLDEYGNIIDTQTGKIQENTGVILANIEARKQQALIDYYSDDYAKAIGEQEDARQTVYGLAEEYRKLRTEAGKQEWIDNYIEKVGRADLAEGAYKEHLKQTKNALEQSKTEFEKTSEVVSTLDGKISNATEKMNEANQVIKDAAAAQDELDRRNETVTADVTGNMKKLSDSMEKAGESDATFNAVAESLEAISVSAKEMDDVDMSKLVSAFSDAGSSMTDVIGVLEDGGVHMDTWNAALEAAPGAAENMGSVTSAAFQAMYDSASGSLEDTMTLIAGLDSVQVGDKTFYITDNGSIFDEQGQVLNIKTDIASIPTEVITTYYGDNKDALQSALDAKKKTDEFGKQKSTAKLDVKDNASKPTESAQGKVDKFGRTSVRATAGINDYASGTINYIRQSLVGLDGKRATVTVTTVEKKVKQATGGYNTSPVIPRHASGYIATGPTLTNQGWIGEDGIEAVANWATGGAVVPLTNKRYMLPIADAIADGMSKRMGSIAPNNQITVTVTGVSSPDDVADAIARKFQILNL